MLTAPFPARYSAAATGVPGEPSLFLHPDAISTAHAIAAMMLVGLIIPAFTSVSATTSSI
jgi:hypothetical protein